MTEDQAFEAIKNAIRLESLGVKTARQVTPEILRIMEEVKSEILSFPGPAYGLAREIRYKQFELRLASLFTPLSQEFYLDLTSALSAEVPSQIRWAQEYIKTAELAPASQAVAMAGQTGIGVQPAPGTGPVGQTFIPQFTRAQMLAIVEETKVLEQRLRDLFGWDDPAQSPYTKSAIKKIDQVVKRGFLLGETNEEIASNLANAERALQSEAKAIARTAVMDMSHRAHYREWDANSDRIVMYEYDATFDYRVCDLCYPHDGKRAKTRAALFKRTSEVPVHPNCRCSILPLTRTALELEKQDMKDGMTQSIVEVNKRKSDARGRVYKTPARVKVNGETVKMTKSSRDIEARSGKRVTMGDFIAQTTPDTRQQVLGVYRAKEFEYLVNDNRGPRLTDYDEVLRRVTLADADQLRKAQRSRARRKKE